jgi:hypothetical protein
MTSGNGLTIAYTPFNKPETITRGTHQIGFAHDPEHQRFKQVAASGETIYLNGGGVLSERLIGSGGATQWTDYLFAGGGMVGMRVEHSTSGTYTRYFHKDHLGSIATITNETGAVVERLSYDAWGSGASPMARTIHQAALPARRRAASPTMKSSPIPADTDTEKPTKIKARPCKGCLPVIPLAVMLSSSRRTGFQVRRRGGTISQQAWGPPPCL